MSEDKQLRDIPAIVADLVRDVQRAVAGALGVEPDLTAETLPLVDRYLRVTVSAMAADERAERVGAIGAYFGEVARRKLDGRWARLEHGPSSWRLELSSCFLHFLPFGMVGESLLGCESEEYDGTFATLDELHDELQQALQNAPPMPEDEYYSLAGRLEILSMVADWLVSRGLARAKDRDEEPARYSADDYRIRLDDDDDFAGS
jgi:hypothetical protein